MTDPAVQESGGADPGDTPAPAIVPVVAQPANGKEATPETSERDNDLDPKDTPAPAVVPVAAEPANDKEATLENDDQDNDLDPEVSNAKRGRSCVCSTNVEVCRMLSRMLTGHSGRCRGNRSGRCPSRCRTGKRQRGDDRARRPRQ